MKEKENSDPSPLCPAWRRRGGSFHCLERSEEMPLFHQHQLHEPPDQRTKMLETPVPSLIVTLAIPTIISMMVTSIYNMADTYFVSQLSTSASGAVGIVFSIMSIIQAVGFTVGMGSGSIAARLMARGITVTRMPTPPAPSSWPWSSGCCWPPSAWVTWAA